MHTCVSAKTVSASWTSIGFHVLLSFSVSHSIGWMHNRRTTKRIHIRDIQVWLRLFPFANSLSGKTVIWKCVVTCIFQLQWQITIQISHSTTHFYCNTIDSLQLWQAHCNSNKTHRSLSKMGKLMNAEDKTSCLITQPTVDFNRTLNRTSIRPTLKVNMCGEWIRTW